MIYLKNSQRKYAINEQHMHNVLETLLGLLKYTDFDISLLLTNDQTIRTYNRDYRGKDKATDVLSFPYQDVQAGRRVRRGDPEDLNLGDLIISVEYVAQQLQDGAISSKYTLEQHLTKLIVHGICHLLGYDHIEDKDWFRMRAKEGWLLKKLKEHNLF